MRRLLRRFWFRLRWFTGRLIALILLVFLFFWLVGPYERADLQARFDPSAFRGDIDKYFATQESRFDDIVPGVKKRVIWAAAPGQQSDWVVLYVHGFSATSEEIRPVADHVARALNANLIYTRLQGHGRSGDALAEGTVSGWMRDIAEALSAARLAGRRTLVIATSTGGTLVAAAAQDRRLMSQVAGIVMVSPNFGINSPLASLLTWPAARMWLPSVLGDRRSFPPANADVDRYWTTDYPTVAVLPMAALVQKVVAMDHSNAQVPALFMFSKSDQVVRAGATTRVASAWGGPVTILHPRLTDTDDPSAHVIAGDIMSPDQTDWATQAIIDWARGL